MAEEEKEQPPLSVDLDDCSIVEEIATPGPSKLIKGEQQNPWFSGPLKVPQKKRPAKKGKGKKTSKRKREEEDYWNLTGAGDVQPKKSKK